MNRICLLAIIGFIISIPLANLFIANIGYCVANNGPCLLPVGFGYMAPSGVFMIGITLICRDVVHSFYRWRICMVLIGVGTAISIFTAPISLAVASGTAFLLAEIADLLVYKPLHRRFLILAVIISGLVGAVVDSTIFLMMAFGSLNFLVGQVLGKMWATIVAVPIILAYRWTIRQHHAA